MNRLKRYVKEIEVCYTLYHTLAKRGYFDYWLEDYDEVMFLVAQTCQVSTHFVKRVFWKIFLADKENQKFVDNLEY